MLLPPAIIHIRLRPRSHPDRFSQCLSSGDFIQGALLSGYNILVQSRTGQPEMEDSCRRRCGLAPNV